MKALSNISLKNTIAMTMAGSVSAINSTKTTIRLFLLTGMIILVGELKISVAQLPDCTTGTVVYGVFSPANPPTGGVDSTEIRPINTTTGAVGALMGARRYYIRNQIGATWYYGTASLGLDALTHRFYMITQMGGGAGGAGQKDIISIDPLLPTATGTIIASTASAYDNYHFVKLAIAPNGNAYTIGVHRDTTTAAATFNPLVRFSTCGVGVPVAGCANASVITLGYLPTTATMYKQRIYNGDIAFDFQGNLYFLSAAFEPVGGSSKYTDARLFKIKATDIPSSAGVGTIPMTWIADYNIIDSTGVSGIALDNTGKMYLSVKRFAGNNPSGAFTSEFYKSSILGSAAILVGLAPIPPNTALSDLASCLFPQGVLAQNEINLSSNYVSGMVSLRWQVHNNDQVMFYEVQNGTDEMTFERVTQINVQNATQSSQIYTSTVHENGNAKYVYYRIRAAMPNGVNYYSNVVKVNNNSKITLIGSPNPNPFLNKITFNALLRNSGSIAFRMADQDGRLVYQKVFTGQAGANNLSVDNLTNLKPGVYLAEIRVDDEVIHQKLIKQ